MSEAENIARFFRTENERNVSLATRGLALRALSGLVMRTPVDTGRARGNWQVSIGAPRDGETGVNDRGGNSAIASGSQAIAAQRGFQTIVIQNNVPYIELLNDGHSAQAPKGYVEGTLASLGLSTGRG